MLRALLCSIFVAVFSLTSYAEYVQLDIRPYCNMGFKDDVAGDKKGGWTDQGMQDMRNFPTGSGVFGGVPFDIVKPSTNAGKSCIITKGRARQYFADSATIPVNRKFATVYILHTGAWGNAGAKYILNYSDGTTASIKANKNNIGDWVHPVELPEAKLAWEGQTESGSAAAVWLLTWINPQPDKLIKSLTIKARGASVTAVLGITGSTELPPAEKNAKNSRKILQGLLKLDSYYFYKGRPVLGTLRLKNNSPKMMKGKVVITLTAGEKIVSTAEHKLWRNELVASDSLDIPVRIPNNLPEGLYKVNAYFEKAKGERLKLDT